MPKKLKTKQAKSNVARETVRNDLHHPSELEFDELAATVNKIQHVLWPDGDRDHEWSPDTIDEVADILCDAGLGPDYTR